ncbi:MAG: hypothetical protein LOD89_07945, partial [Tissierellales bacterium]
LFMDTGIGKDGYSIVGQGRIDEILSTKPEDRRNIFEEAAGIIKYKSKKAEAEKKLESTNNNLVRIKDIIIELQSQHDNLKEQSDKARVYIDLSNKVKEIEVNLLIREIESLKEEINNLRIEREKVEVHLNSLMSEKRKLEDKLNELKEAISTKDQIYETIEKQRDDIVVMINENKSRLTVLEEKIKFYNKDIERLKGELDSLNQKLAKLENEKVYLSEVSATSEEELNISKEDYLKKNDKVERLNEKIKNVEQQIQDGKNRIVDLYNLVAEKKSKLNGIINFRDNILKRIDQIKREIDLLQGRIEESQKFINKLEEDELEKNRQIIEGNKHLTSLTLEEERLRKELEHINSIIDQNKIELQDNIARFNMLKNMEDG